MRYFPLLPALLTYEERTWYNGEMAWNKSPNTAFKRPHHDRLLHAAMRLEGHASCTSMTILIPQPVSKIKPPKRCIAKCDHPESRTKQNTKSTPQIPDRSYPTPGTWSNDSHTGLQHSTLRLGVCARFIPSTLAVSLRLSIGMWMSIITHSTLEIPPKQTYMLSR